jgi:hypothetical protein
MVLSPQGLLTLHGPRIWLHSSNASAVSPLYSLRCNTRHSMKQRDVKSLAQAMQVRYQRALGDIQGHMPLIS